MSALERAAKAVADFLPKEDTFRSLDEDYVVGFDGLINTKALVRAVLMAVQEISPDQSLALFAEFSNDDERTFTAMIDALLNEPPTPGKVGQ